MDRVRAAIDAMLDEYDARQIQIPTTRVIWERLLDEHDAEVSYGTVRSYLARTRRDKLNGSRRATRRSSGNMLASNTFALQGAVVRHYRDLLTSLRQRPSIHGVDGSYATISAFVLGCDAGSSGGMLTGFREWLIVRLGTGNNLTWTALVLHLTPGGLVHPLTAEADAAAVATLFQLLDEFLEQREHRDGLFTIYSDYQSWLNTQSWHRTTPATDQNG